MANDVLSGLLSKETSFRLVVEGPYALREVTNLIAILEQYKRILEDDGPIEDVKE